MTSDATIRRLVAAQQDAMRAGANHHDAMRAAVEAVFVSTDASVTSLAGLLERALEWLRFSLRSDVECACVLRAEVMDEVVPVPGSCDPEMRKHCEAQLELVRAIEAVIGPFADHDEPQWLDDLVAGRWAL